MKKVSTDVCIVGSGPAGALLGLLLAKKGHEVILLERFSHFNREYRGEILQPSTLNMLDDLGLLEYILEQPHNRIEKGGIYASGKRIMNFTMEDLSHEYPFAIQMAQATFIEALLAEAKKYPNFSILMNAHIKELVKDEDHKIIGVKGTIEKEPAEILARITVGSDGRNSTLRKLSPFQVTNEHHRSNLIWFTVDWPSHLPYDLMYMLTGQNNLFMIPKYPNKMQIGYTFTKDQLSRVKENNYEEIKKLSSQQFPEIKTQLDAAKDFVQLQVISLTLNQWSTDGFVLIGDAAHVMTPIGVIGINVALADAITAGNVIGQSLNEEDYSEEKLTLIDQERKAEVDMLQNLQIRIESIIFTTNPMISRIRPLFINIVSKTPLVKKLMRKFFFPVKSETTLSKI
ncbi:MAG TPA: hypothetical protein DCR24_03430 [Bacillus bacterium]|nr:hypothetical protein [Bacillus sp. (in: firmicutes)]